MAQLRDTVISGSLRATDTIYTNKIQTSIIGAPTSSNGATFGVGTNGQVLKSNGTSVYWSSDSGVTSVRVQATSPVTSSVNTAQTGSLDTTIALANNYGDTKNPYASKTKNTVLAAPATADGVPGFRALVADDIPTISAAKASLGNVSNNANLNSTTGAKGDIIYWSATNTPAHLTNTSSTTKHFLSITSQAPSWSTVTKGDVGLGNVENTALSTWTGTNKITTVGTIGTGTWQGTAIGATYVGNLPASKINSGTFDAARIPTLSITDKTTGTLTVDRGGTGVTTASPHCVFAGPKTGTAAAAPTWRNIDSTDIKPILSKTYENYTVTANDGNTGVIYFATVTPANTSNYFAPWWVHYTLEVTTTENQTQGFYDVYWGQAGTTITYHIFNNFYSSTYYPIYHHRVLYPKDGQQSKGAHLGVRIQSARNPTTLARTYKVNILEYGGCTVAFKDSLTTYQSLYNSTYYNSGEYNGTSAGLQETGDADTTGRDYSHSGYLTNGSTLRLPPISLYGLDRENKAQAFSLYSADYTSSTTNINTARVYNTAGIDWTRGIWHSNSWTNFAKSADLNISPSFMYYAVDFRYTDNCIAAASATTLGLVARKPVFFRGYIKEDGLFYLDPLSVTYNNATYKRAWTQDIPTSKTYNGTYQHVYWKIGDVYYNSSCAGSGYQVNLLVENKLYWYNNNRFEEYGGNANTVNGHTINADVPSGAKFTDTTYTAATAAPGKVASASAQGTSTNYARQDHTHGIDVDTGDANGQVKIAGQNASVKGLAALAYKASLTASDIPELNASKITAGTLPVSRGGTGATSFTANSVIMSGSTTTAALTTKAITDNSSNADVTSSDTNLITGRTLYYQLAKKGYLTSHQTITQDGLTGSIVNRYTYCTTAADTAEKKISFNSGTLNQVIGATLRVQFKYSNTAANPTLNINNSGNVPIYKFGTTRPGTTPEDSWSAGEIVTFVFDGPGWQMSSNPIMGLTTAQEDALLALIT